MATPGMTHGEIMKVRHYDYQLDALDKIRLLRQRMGREPGLDAAEHLGKILDELEDKVN